MRRCQQVLRILAVSVLSMSLRPVMATPIPSLNLSDLVRDADLIAIGQVTRVREDGKTIIEQGGQSIAARRMIATLHVVRILKGTANSNSITVGFSLPEIPLGYAGIAASEFGMFFLHKWNGHEYLVTNPYYPFLVASMSAPPGGVGSDFDRVVAEIAQVLIVPGASLDQRRSAIDVLGRVKTTSAIVALRAASREADPTVRLRAAAFLLRQDDVSVLTSVEDILVKAPENIDASLLRGLAFAIQDGIKNQEAIPILTRVLRTQDVQIRRAAAAALRHTEVDGAVEPLSIALEDDDREVRYHAVLGLATITGQTEWGPALDQFGRDEQRYLNHWRNWLRTK